MNTNSKIQAPNTSLNSKNDELQNLNHKNGHLEEWKTCIHEIIQAQVLSQPDAQAVCTEEGSLSYCELDQVSTRLARYLVTLGVGPEVIVPLCFDKSMWNVISMLGVLKAGAAFVPLDPTAPIARLQTLVQNVRAKIILCSQKQAGLLSAAAESIIPIDGDVINQLPQINAEDKLPSVQSASLAYLIYTSGTTGQPKATMIEHGAFCSGARAHAPAMLIKSTSRVLQFAAHTFDASLVEILTTLIVGGTVCIPSEDTRLNNVVGAINDMQVNLAILTPSFVGFIDPAEVPGLKTLVLAGEAMSHTHINTWSGINLVNGYGPSECSVAAVVNSKVTPETEPTNIGLPVGAHLWVVDPDDYQQRVPPGSVGELLVQGPTLARGYHNDPEKTAESFVQPPAWASAKTPSEKSWRMYKTGDLVKQSPDGTYRFIGRKDHQVKVHGQRVELEEIEQNFVANPTVKHGLVMLPKSGPFKGRLISIISLSTSRDKSNEATCLQVVEDSAEASQRIQKHLASRLPAYMVPSIFIFVNDIPLLPSGKLDRKGAMNWAQDLSEEEYRRIVVISEPSKQARDSSSSQPSSELESKLRLIWSHVLNLHSDQVDLNRSFLSLGGDSISAMQVKGQCTKKNINLSVQEILRSKSIVQLAQCAKAIEQPMQHKEILDKAFDLSPIQSLFFKLPNQGLGHFNQSFFLRITQRIEEKDLRNAIETVIARHSMLRARFSISADTGIWQQRISNDITTSYQLKGYNIAAASEATEAIAESQTCLNPVTGPLFAADLFDVDGDDQLLFMVGHHLVIDLVSWRVILEDLEEILRDPTQVSIEAPLSFQTWCQLQAQHSQELDVDRVLPVEEVPAGDAEYWGMGTHLNIYGDVLCEGFEIDPGITSLLLTKCHDTLHTETIDILLSALIHSFASVFPDRKVPAIYNEGHGREPSGMAADLSRTVGWFTIMYPVHVPSSASKDLIETVRHVKDLRRKISANGREYFASRCLTAEGEARFGHHWPLEITFNYLGQYQQLERAGALLTPVDEMAGEARGAGGTADVGKETPRFGIFEISAVVVQGKLRFSFTFNRHMQQKEQISNWISVCRRTIGEIAEKLVAVKPQVTLGDFPLLSLDYERLHTMVSEKLPQVGVQNVEDVEDIYPCSSMQEGLLISQTKDTGFYAVQVICELKIHNTSPHRDRLAEAWQKVVNRHASLRTVFIESVSKDEGLYDQVVLKKVEPNVVQMNCSSERYALRILGEKRPMTYEAGQPPHRFTICETADKRVLCKLEISHTIMDGGSMSIILRDLGLAYEGLLQDASGPLYSDYIGYLQNRPGEASIEYWKNYLLDAESCTFPILNDGIAVEKELRSLRLDFSSAEFSELKNFCDQNGVTISNALHTAWGLTLRCYTDANDICFGYLTSGRDAPVAGIEDAVGPFINMLVCRMNMVPANRLGAVLEQVQKDYMDSIPHRYTSLAEVQHALKLSGTALFNTALSYRKLPSENKVDQSDVSFVERVPIYDPTEYNLSINIEASDRDAVIDLDYWTDAISAGQASNIAATFIKSLQNIVHHSQQMIEQLDHLSDHGFNQILRWNSKMPEAIEDCVHNVIKQQAQIQPSAPAVCAWDAEFTYAELDDLSSRLANYLTGLNVKPEAFVPTCFDKSGYTLVAMLAVLKAGAAAVPLDATHPKSALELRVSDTKAQVVLAAPSRATIFEGMVPSVVSVSKEFLDQLPKAHDEDSLAVQPTNPCFVIYTSGSTGKPKGVVLEHRAIVTSGHATSEAYGFGSHSRVLQFAAYTFDNSLAEIFFTLMRGGCVCVPSEHDRFNNLAEAINTLDVNFMDITPTVASFLHPSDVPQVKGVSLGGEPLTKENIETWGKAVALHCCYGPSECSVNSTWNGDLNRSLEATNIGRSIGSVSWVVDPNNHDHLTPIGGVGELLIEGPILARGYLNDPGKTSKSFIQDLKWAVGGNRRMYKTGDLVRLNSNGTITYLGRKDTQVKLNGQRLEIGEVEHHLKTNLPTEAQSVVELVKITHNQKSTKALAAFLCLQSDGSVPTVSEDNFLLQMTDSIRSTAANLESALTASLPAYMVPSIYIPVASMPMTSSGKLDRRRLRLLCESLSADQISMYRLARKSGQAPSTEMEKMIASLWEAVLGIQKGNIGKEDNFFRRGGDSIGAMKLITAARARGVALTVADVFRRPMLVDCAREAKLVVTAPRENVALPEKMKPFSILGKKTESISELKKEVASLCRVEERNIQDIYPCTAIQEGLVALSNKDPGAYVAQNVYQLPSDIDLKKFKAAWQKVAEVEVILRTRVVYTESSGFLQVVVREPIVWHTAATLQEVVDEHRLLPAFNGGLLSRYTLVEEQGSLQFVWTAHHALYDGWCIPVMLEKVEAYYLNITAKVDNTASYPNFIKFLSDIDATESDEFWKSKLSETSALQFPSLPHPSYQVHATSLSSHTALVSREAGSHITLPSTIRAAWAMVVGVYSGGQEDVVFGETLTGRDAPVDGITDMIGPTLATVPTRIRINPDTTVSKFLEDVQNLSADAIPYQYAGLQHIKHISEDTRIACNFQNLLAIHHDSTESSDGFWDLRSSGTIGTNFYSYPLTMSCQIGDGKVDIDAHYDQDVISTWQIEKMLHQFEFILECLNSPDTMNTKISDINMLNSQDHATIMGWNSETVKPVNKCIHQLIEQQVCEQPESAIAVDSWDAKFTYRELDEFSTRLAQHLMEQNVESTLIPLIFEKSAWTIVAMLAVLKAGAAFVPLDPTAPTSRLSGIFADTKATIVLCSAKYLKLCDTFDATPIKVDRADISQLAPAARFAKRWDELPSCDSKRPAYCIFTSGTTGKPKGTIVQHAAFCGGAASHAPALRMQSTSRVLQFASYTFDASLLEILTTLTLGGTVCVPSDEDRLNNITKVINEMRITWTLLTPSFIQLIQPSQIPTLRTLVLGGEAMSQSHISTWADKLELINAYGPSECAVVATVNPHISLSTDPANMGRAVGGRAWITDIRNHDRLAPIGSIGELVIEGPILAQGYLNNEAKTAEVFIENPAWSVSPGISNGVSTRRMYKTGDLVKYTLDGNMIFCGRKDTQVKLHGQRLELGEVEHYMRTDPSIQHALATIPASGFCNKRLVAVISLQELATSNSATATLEVVAPEVSSFYLSGIRERLCSQLPAYMIPSNWVVLQRLPLLPSGKLDRRQIDKWVEEMSPDIYRQISDVEHENDSSGATVIERQLQIIWGNALNLPAEQIGLHQSFLHLGGDSISAMQVMSKCRSQDLGVTVQDIIQSKSISQLAQCVTLPETMTFDAEALDTPFDLSPMQKLYFECVGDKWSHFNQSVLLRIGRKMQRSDVVTAIEKIVASHSMLRARFRQAETGVWQQQISSDMTSSYQFESKNVSMDDVPSVVEHSQKSLDIQNGPTFAVELLNIEGDEQQLISLVAHHLVIDVVSWRIILQDLEDVLESGNIKAESSLPFQTWSRLHVEHTQQNISKSIFHPSDVPVADLAYWDMAGKSNVYGDTVEDGFEIDAETSLLLLGTCHDSLNTDPVDIFLASVMASFRKVFSDRSASPAIFNEGHGREPWASSKLDLSRTVGWFTTMCPIYLPSTAEGDVDLVNTIRWVKDLRNRVPSKGREYFAYRLLTEEGKQRFPGHWPMEVTFNYLGKLQQLERKDAILQQVDGATNADFDIGSDVPRFALFEISAQVAHGKIKVSFSYNKKMKRQAKIRRWVMECQRSLQDAAQRLVQIKPERTLSDFQLLPLSYTGMSKLNEKLPRLGVASMEEVEDVYPCSPMQQGMLLAQLKNPHLYAYVAVFEARSAANQGLVDARLLAEAWQDVVSRHSALRSIFIESISESSLMDQVVIKNLVARVAWLESEDPKVDETFAKQENISFRDKQPPHRFTLCKTDKQRVFCKLEISHTISDGTSIPILLRDLSQAYETKISSEDGIVDSGMTVGRAIVETRSRRNSIALPGLLGTSSAPLYSEYIAHIQSKSPAEDLNYWKAYLADIEPCSFPALTDGKKVDKELRSLVLNLTRSSELRDFCTQNGVTLSNVLQLVWALVLRTYTGSTDVCFGYLTSGRDAPIRGIQDSAVGAFINMLTCRLDLKEELPLNQALDQIQNDFIKSMHHQACSLANIQHELQLSGTSLFNTAFTFQKRSSSSETTNSAIEFDILDAQDPSEYDVTVNVEALDSGVEVHFGYWSNILSEPQAISMSKTFDHILNQMIAGQSQGQTISEIDFFSNYSRQQVMGWNSIIPAKIDRCIHEVIDQQKSGRPASTPAISAWDGNLTYADLEHVTNRLAARLMQLGVGPETYVPLCFEKSMWTVVSMIAVMKAGGAFVPLDPSHPQGRLKHFIDDVRANLVLCSSMHQEKISGAVDQTLVVDQNLIDGLDNLPLLSTAKPSYPAYIIFTSGTTGLPKGTIIEHAAFCTSATEHARAMNMRSDSRVFQFASHTFDASVMEILSTLIVGGCVCIPSDMDRMNDIPGAIRRMGVTWTLLTPSVANTLTPKGVPSLKVLVTGGEAMSSGHIAKWKGGKICLVNAYGPSETAVIASTSTKVDEDGNEVNSDTSNIGKAIGGRNWIVDPRNYNKLVPVGGIGELVVEGHIVARGYLNNEQKTAQAFVSHPDWLKDVKDQERMYRTGDLVRYNTDGTLSFVARKDTQIKLNGQRIELGEIEHQVKANMPEDSQSAVELVAPMSRIATKALAVFFCLPNARKSSTENEEILTEDEILLPMSKVARRVAKNLDSALAGVLPTYMIPSFYIPVTKMPWTSSGKLDRTRLRNIVATLPKESTAPYRLANTENKTATAAPTSDMEKKLQKLWENVMNVGGSVGVEDSFFRLGGDSVTAMKLVGAARLEGISLTVIDIFRNPKLADMALVCGVLEEEAQTELKEFALLKTENVNPILDEIVEQCQVDREMIQDAYPCSFLQEGLLTLSIRQAGAYVAHNMFKIPVDLDIERFKSVWQKTVDEVDILRTRIVHMESSAFIQVVIKPEPIVWHTAKKLEDVKTEDIKLPTHNGGALTQYTIVEQEGSDKRFFVWSIHHGLYDGWSMPMVLSRVQSAYFDSSSSFPKSSYASFIKYVTDVDLQASDEFWRTRLANAAPLQFPQNVRAESNQVRDNQMISHSIAISDDSAGMEVTIPTIIRAAWAMIVATYSGSNDVVFGETLAGRDIPVTGITDIIGPIFTTVPTRIQVDRDSTISQFLRGVHQMATEIIPYQHAGLQRIKRLDSDTDQACDFGNLLVIQTAEEETQDEFWQLAVDGVADNFFTYPLVLECKASLDSTKVDINAHFDANVIGNWQVQRLLFQLDAVLKQLSTAQSAGIKKTLADVEIFSPQDLKIVKEWNSKIPNSFETTVHEEFEEVAASQPHAIALESWDGTFTYQQVKEHAERMAHRLIDLGVGPDVFVPICMDKSAWAIISMLGIMMAGGAYSPFDIAAPVSRHQEMIGDLDARVVLCTPKYSERYVGMVDHVLSIDAKFYATLPQIAQSGHNFRRATSKNAAYVIFTSGSTGKPKGCVLEHGAISTSSVAMRDSMLMEPDSRVYQFGSYTFDVSVLEIFTTLTYGGTVVIPSEETRVSDVSEALAKLNINWTFLTPSVANLVEPSIVPNLKVLVCGGEAMTLENVLKWAPHLTLVNAYGPTEASVIGLVNMNVSTERNPANIGFALAGNHAWIADPTDHNRIAPVGCPGELLLEGPILAREYVKNKAKTDEVFIHNPPWTSLFDTGKPSNGARRMYKTGDLVRYNENGTVTFIGRKDNQVKLHGQRMELGEIENALDIDQQIRHALVALPKTGHFKKRLVAILSLTDIAPVGITRDLCEPIQEGPRGVQARAEVAKAKNRLSERLPAFMIPSTWIAVESIPLLPSGKLDRRGVTGWLEKIDEKMYEKIMEADDEEDNTISATDTSRLIQSIFSRVLNIPIQKVRLGSSFLSLGGDSITAMQVMALCRKEKMNFSLSEVLRSKSIHQLALAARFETDKVFQEEKVEELFDLSPIQQLYFQAKSADQQRPGARFNQSFSLQITRKVESQTIKDAINAIVNQHSMLRARMSRNSAGSWKQRITKDAASSYRFRIHDVEDENAVPPIVANSQSSLDVQNGPLFAVDLFNISGQDQVIFMAAHHLVIDMMSWRIILGDLEEFINTGKITSDKPLSFQTWLSMQADNSENLTANARLGVLPFKVGPSNIEYWAMNGRENTYSDVICETFTVSEEITKLALGESNKSLRTEPVDVFLSAIAHSFSRVFVDRETPALYNENHGRESWDSSIDISRTVGWFTTIFPVQIEVETDEDDVVDSVRRMKDVRRKVPENGRPYFAHRFITQEGKEQFKDHDGTMEVIFNYLGRMQQLEHDDSLLQQWTHPENEENEKLTADVGPQAERFALFEISAAVIRDKIQFSFLFNEKMEHQPEIRRWIAECQTTLEETVSRLAEMKDELTFTLSDFPLLPISYDGLKKIVTKSLPQVGITPEMVDEIFPAAPLQEGLILSQIKDPSLYHFHAVFDVHPAGDGVPIDANRLLRAWQKVVDYHGALRTVFADSVYKGDIFNQIVVKKTDSGAKIIECEESEALEKLSKISILDHNYQKQPRLPHQITIAKTSAGKVYFKAEINHGVIDGGSANVMLRDLAAAYHDTLDDGPGPSYGNYIKFIKNLPTNAGTKFWKTYLEGARACHFPVLNKEPTEKRLGSCTMEFDRFPELQDMCKRMKVTLANVMQAAWALCLRSYTKSEDVCFGYLTSGRDVPVPGISDTIGAYINMLVCRVKFSPQSTLKEVYQKVQNDYLGSLEFQHTSLAQLQHDIAGGKPLFNTAVSIQKGGAADEANTTSITFDPVAAHDPGEYAITLNVRTFLNDEGIVLRYWTNFINDEQATLLAATMSKVLENFVNQPFQTVEDLDLSTAAKKKTPPKEPERSQEPQQSPQTLPQLPVLDSSEQLRTIISECVREVIEQMFKSGTLVSYGQQDIQDTMNFVNRQVVQRHSQAVPMIDYSQLSPPPPEPQIQKTKRVITSEITKPAPNDDIERRLLAIWSDLLQISEDSIRGDDSFFQLGGDSIIAMQMVGIARDEDLALTVASIFRHPTFADMAAVIRLADEANAPLDITGQTEYKEAKEMRAQTIQNALYQRYSLLEAANVDAFLQDNICPRVTTFRGGIVDVFPVTDFQALAVTGTLMESKWMLNYFHLSGEGPLDLKKLKLSVSRLVDAFDILRTVFVPYGNRFFQVVLRKLQPSFEVHETDDLASFTSQLQQSDRENGPRLGESYLQFTVAKERASSRHRIIMRMSHAQYDGVCMPAILGALQSAYRGQPIQSVPAFSTYVRDAARRTTDDHYTYWKKLLKGSSMTDVIRRRGPNYSRGSEVTSLKRIVQFESLSSEAITPATIIKAAWSLVLAQLSAGSDVVFGNVISGRNAAVLGVESIIGPCVNLVPVRIAFRSDWTVRDLLRQIQDQQVGNMPYESLGFREIIKHCTDWPDWTNFSTVCQHQNIQRKTQLALGKNEYTLGAIGSQEDFADITVLSTPQGDEKIEISLIFSNNSGITQAFAEEMFDVLCSTSTDFSMNPDQKLPSPTELSEMECQTIDDPTPAVDASLSSNLQGISRAELLVYNDVLTRAWGQILWDKNGSMSPIDLDSSFYELGGDIIGVAQVASLLEQEGFKLRIEDLVDHPVLIEQLALCSVYVAQQKEIERAEAEEDAVREFEPNVPQKKGLKNIFGKGLKKKMTFGRKKGGAATTADMDGGTV